MPLLEIRRRAANALVEALKNEFDHVTEDVVLEIPPRRDLGERRPCLRISRVDHRLEVEALEHRPAGERGDRFAQHLVLEHRHAGPS